MLAHFDLFKDEKTIGQSSKLAKNLNACRSAIEQKGRSAPKVKIEKQTAPQLGDVLM